MTYCEQCGSTSFDELGFCRGCGRRPPAYAPAQFQATPTTQSGKPPGIVLPEQVAAQSHGHWGVAQPSVKNVWGAVLLALFLGPFGMTYSTYLGAFVMFVVSTFALFFSGRVVIWVFLPLACAVWAGVAAKRANSIY